jgi:hypothetical protein
MACRASKAVFYHALNIASFRVGKRGFSAEAAKRAFDLAHEKRSCFSPGWAVHIIQWKEVLYCIVLYCIVLYCIDRINASLRVFDQ